MKFSERKGFKEVKTVIQIDWVDEELKNGLWNVFLNLFGTSMKNENTARTESSKHFNFIKTIWSGHYKMRIDTIPYYISDTINELRRDFYDNQWYEIYDFIEFIVKNPGRYHSQIVAEEFNTCLKKELSAFRFIGEELVEISDENQIAQIQDVINNTSNRKLEGVNIHIKSSLQKLSDRKNPDYRNSIKESISAIESLAQVITGSKNAELGKALKIIKNKLGIHSALEQGFLKIYGYTSDGDGIRHALLEETNIDLEDALFMLVSCSAFINYLIVKATKAGIELE